SRVVINQKLKARLLNELASCEEQALRKVNFCATLLEKYKVELEEPLKFFWDSELDAFISERLNSDHFTHAARKWSSFHAENLAVYERKNKKIKDISADFKTRDERFSSKKVYEMDAFWERVILGERWAEMDNEFTKLLLRLKELDISVIQAVANSDSTFQAKMIEALGFASEQDVINRVNPLLEAEVHLL